MRVKCTSWVGPCQNHTRAQRGLKIDHKSFFTVGPENASLASIKYVLSTIFNHLADVL